MTEIPAEFTLQIQVLVGHGAVTFEGSKLLQNVRNHFPINNTASYHIGPEYPSTPLQEPQISQFNLVTDILLQIKIRIFSNDSFLVLTPCITYNRSVSTFGRNENRKIIIRALREAGREDVIGHGKRALVR